MSTTAATTPVQVAAWKAQDGTLCPTPELALLRDAADIWSKARRAADTANDKLRDFARKAEVGDKVDLEAMREAVVQMMSAARFVNETRDVLDAARKDAGVK